MLCDIPLLNVAFADSPRDSTAQSEPVDDERQVALEKTFDTSVQQVVNKYCAKCHNAETAEAEVDFSKWKDWQNVLKGTKTLQRVQEQLHTGQMPPPEADPLPLDAKEKTVQWLEDWLALQAEKVAGDPGPVLLRRLNNAEYTNTVRDLTGLSSLQPAREFPADSAAGEGFSNTGAALVMSPSMVRKYLDAAKAISENAVLLPDRIEFSANPSRSDMTNTRLQQIRDFYAKYTDQSGGATVNLQGIVFETNQGGRLPFEKYLLATLELREKLKQPGSNDPRLAIQELAKRKDLSPRYLEALWNALQQPNAQGPLASIQKRWGEASIEKPDGLIAEVMLWQKALWKFSSVGHIGKRDGPKSWQEPVNPIRNQQELRYALPKEVQGEDVTLYLQLSDAGDGSDGDAVVLANPRLVAPGRQDLSIRDMDRLVQTIDTQRNAWVMQTEAVFAALDRWMEGTQDQGLQELAVENRLPVPLVKAWAKTLGLAEVAAAQQANSGRRRLEKQIGTSAGFDFVRGWVAEDALSIISNASDQQVRVPGVMPPKSIGVHPSPSRSICTSWRAPAAMSIECKGMVRHAHSECGNGIAWRVELRRGSLHQVLGSGFSNGASVVPFGPFPGLRVRPRDEVVLVIEPRDGNHSCDLTNIELEIANADENWSLSKDICDNILAGNPHADSKGREGVWEFFTEPAIGKGVSGSGATIPPQSLLAKWFNEADPNTRRELIGSLQRGLGEQGSKFAADSPDAMLIKNLLSASGPFLIAALEATDLAAASESSKGTPQANQSDSKPRYGLAASMFGVQRDGQTLGRDDVLLQAPSVLEIRLPAALAVGAEFVTSAALHPVLGKNGSVQLGASDRPPTAGSAPIPKTSVVANDPNWTNVSRNLLVSSPVLVSPSADAETRVRESFDRFRELFPIALCYTKIVPVDEVVTLTLFYREDEMLRRLILDADQAVVLERMWSDLHYVSQDAIKSVDAYEQLWQFATQDADPSAFEPLREPLKQKAAEFRQAVLESEPRHVDWVVQFARRAFRQPISNEQESDVRGLYRKLRDLETPHEEAIRLLLARVLVSPEFLYRVEIPRSQGIEASNVTDLELANRLSYFLWASMPDQELIDLAAANKLSEPGVLRSQVLRMLKDPRIERMAVEFGTMWLHVKDLDTLDEKSESAFPEFTAIRQDLYGEVIQLVTDAIRNDRSITDLLSGDYTFLNERLAKFYGIPGVSGDEWRRVEGVRKYGRGGILTLGATLAKQSGASRTSPILRGNWLCEVVLGEKLPKPPKNVPVLAELPPEGMTERALIERHSSDPACNKCHQRIDPYGFSLENYDAIGRYREKDAVGNAIVASTRLLDGTDLNGAADLLAHLEKNRGEDFVRQLNRKLLGYALGRSIQLSDEPILKEINAKQARNGYRLAETICDIVLSKPFRQIRGKDFPEETIE